MGVRETVFGSKEENKYYTKLQKTWGEKLNIYHNVPFLNVFTAKDELVDENHHKFKISEDEYDKLKKQVSISSFAIKKISQSLALNLMDCSKGLM